MTPSLLSSSLKFTPSSNFPLKKFVFQWSKDAKIPSKTALALLLSKYSGQRDFSLTLFRPQDESFSQALVEIRSEAPLKDLLASESPLPRAEASTPTLLVLAPTLPAHLASSEVIFCLPQRSETDANQEAAIHYNPELFSEKTVQAWAKHLRKIASYDPQTLVREVQMLDDAEQQQSLALAGNPSPTLYSQFSPKDFTFPALFAAQCARTPDNRALWCQGEEWTYLQLEDFSNQVANQLCENKGIEVGDKVGVCLERKPQFLGVLLGIMKAGAAYVPLEPDLPKNRRGYIVQDAEVKAIIDQNWLDQLSKTPASSSSPTIKLSSQNAAYVIYTSGSTGEPKGVEVSHHALCDFSLVMRESYQLGTHHTWLAITTIAFDACIMELFPLLLSGGTVAMAPPRLGADGEALSKLLTETQSTHLWATPTTLRILLSSGWQGAPELTIFSGGEVVDREISEAVLPLCKALINGYGPTETTVFATNHLITSGTGPVPLGRPMAHMTMYLLDEDGHLLPPMARGHYWIGGQGVSLGYLNRPELNQKRFLSDPYSPVPNARMYQSGDVGYYDEEGLLGYLSRSDHQVKLRGYRIELGEIENRLLLHPDVEEAVVLVREDRPDEQRLVAYLVAPNSPDSETLQAHLADQLPEYMVPAWFVPMESFPTTSGRKIDRRALPAPPESTSHTPEHSHKDLPSAIAALWARLLGRPQISVQDHVFRLGANSLNATRFQKLLATELDYHLPIAELFQHPTPQALAQHLTGNSSENPMSCTTSQAGPIAIIGMACRFPGAPDLDSYWELIESGREAIQTFTPEELIASGISPSEVQHPDYVPRGTVLEGALDFEPSFFGISRQEASILSPQFRLFMKTSWEALENAGYPEEPANAPIGIFAGAGDPSYLSPSRDQAEVDRLKILVGNSADFLSTRTAFALGLTGPAVSIQTACSTSLVAIADACYALRSGRCSMALAGGVSFSWPHAQGYLAGEGLIFSRQGTCRPFDHRADGTIFSQGAGVVLLKPLEQALKDGDPIQAVIRGIATNNDGNRKANYASPSISGQTDVIRQALDDASVSARDVGYVEAHGTGTRIGDPIEVAALTNAYRKDTDDCNYCGLGSVKGNIGHADAAAGVAGLIKSALALKNQTLPPQLHFERANPEIAFAETPFRIQTKAQKWTQDRNSSPRLAAVSALGMGGTNAHAILEEGPLVKESPATKPSPSWHLLPLSARSPEALEATISRFAHNTLDDQAATAYTLLTGRRQFPHRAFAITSADQDLPEFELHKACSETREPIFLFTGQGSQYLRMGESLLRDEPVFQQAIADCERHLPQGLQWLYPKDGENTADINQTSLTQPALFAVMWAQAQLWKSWGIEPVAMAGHSIGEYVAATLAGVFSLEDALQIVAKRSRLMQSAEPGTMLAVFADSEAITELLQEFPLLDLATINAPDLSVVAGDDRTITEVSDTLEKRDIRIRKVRTSHAFHSRSMEPILAEFEEFLQNFTLHKPQIAYTSNVTGDWITATEATSPGYYTRQLRGTVRFSDNVRTLIKDVPPRLFLEMGPGVTLSGLAARQLGGTPHEALPTFADHKESDATNFARKALGRAWAKGLSLPHPKQTQRRLALPPTSFNEETFEKPQPKDHELSPPSPLFHLPSWKQEPLHLPPHNYANKQPWLIFARAKRHQISDLRGLKDLCKGGIIVLAGNRFSRLDSHKYVIRSNEPDDYRALLESITAEHGLPAGILHTWSLEKSNPQPQNKEEFQNSLTSSAASLTWLAKALSHHALRESLPLTILTSGIYHGSSSPANHTLPAVASVIQKEVPALMTKVLEVGAPRPHEFLSLVQYPEHYPHLAYQNKAWWSPSFAATPLSDTPSTPVFAKDECLLVTGGLGGLALATCLGFAEQTPGIHFILLARNPEPKTEYQTKTLAKIRALGSKITCLKIDLLDTKSIEKTVREIAKLPSAKKLAGILHTAAILDDGAITNKSPESFWKVLTTKIFGSQFLTNRLSYHQLQPRFEIFFSSVASNLGLFGQVDYSAANAYLDGYAAQRRKIGIQSHAINWPAFHSVGMAARVASETQTSSLNFDLSLTNELAENALAPHEAPEAILTILRAKSYPRVAISRLPFRDKQEAAIADGRATRLSSFAEQEGIALDRSPTDQMLEIWREHLGCPELAADDNYFDAGGDSLAAVALTTTIEKTFQRPIPISHLMGSPTAAGLAARLGLSDEPMAPSHSNLPPFLHLLHPGKKDKPPLILIHGASGGVLFLHPFAKQLDLDHPIYAFEAPMLHDLRATAPDSMAEVAKKYLEVLAEHVPGPYLLGGYSLGGIIAFEMAQQLQEQGCPPQHLILFDTPNPTAPVLTRDPVERLLFFWSNQNDEPNALRKVARLAQRFATGTIARIKHEVETQVSLTASRNLPNSKEHWRHIQCREQHSPLEERYVPKPYSGQLTVLMTDFVYDKFTWASNLGWDTIAENLQVLTVTGPHLEIFNPPHLEVLLEATRKCLDESLKSKVVPIYPVPKPSVDEKPKPDDTQKLSTSDSETTAPKSIPNIHPR